MYIDGDKVDDAVLALLRPTLHDGLRVWKGFDWDMLGRLHRKRCSWVIRITARAGIALDH